MITDHRPGREGTELRQEWGGGRRPKDPALSLRTTEEPGEAGSQNGCSACLEGAEVRFQLCLLREPLKCPHLSLRGAPSVHRKKVRV